MCMSECVCVCGTCVIVRNNGYTMFMSGETMVTCSCLATPNNHLNGAH